MLQMVGGQGHRIVPNKALSLSLSLSLSHGRIGMTHGPCDWLFCQHNHSLAHEPVSGTHARCTPTIPTSIQHIGALLRSSHARPEPHRASRFGAMFIMVHLGHDPHPPYPIEGVDHLCASRARSGPCPSNLVHGRASRGQAGERKGGPKAPGPPWCPALGG